ncbi:MAG: glutamyl-tRNA reductase [Leptolyngbya sp. DLM2.Bin15]|nr:MAG: glutamyl-tRNA reductase [Leptolyngbya sp. DLM2.Bin15]
MNIAVVGLSHKTAPVEVREKLSIPTPEAERAMAQLLSYPHIEEVAILSTCNRLEIYLVTKEAEPGIREVGQFLADYGKISLPELREHLFVLLHHDAIMHLMRVSAGLDSLVLGEGQILSQVKHMHKLGQQHNSVGQLLNKLLKQAITAGKRVRTETSIGTGAVSISSAAVELAQMKVDDLTPQKVAVVGAGKMSRLVVKHLLAKGATDIAVVNRSLKGAEELAKEFKSADLKLHTLGDLLPVVAQSDLVFTATASNDPLIHAAQIEPILPAGRSLMLFDISVPRNVHSDVNDLPQVHAFNVDDLKAVVAQNQESRRQIAMEAEELLEEEVESFEAWWRSLETVSTISCLRDKVETIREQELEKALSRLGSEFAEKHQEIIEALTRGIVNKILHDPMVQLRAQQDIEARRHAMQTLHTLFNLEPASEKYS